MTETLSPAAPDAPGGGGPASLTVPDRAPLGEILAAFQARIDAARAATAERAAAMTAPPADARTFEQRMAAWEAADNAQMPCYDCTVCDREQDRPQVCNDPYGYCHPGPCQARTDEWGQPVA